MKTYTYGQIQIVRDALELAHDTSDGEDKRKIRGAIELLDTPLDAFEEVYRLKDEVKRLTAELAKYKDLIFKLQEWRADELAERDALKAVQQNYFRVVEVTVERDALAADLAKYKGITDKLLHDLDAAASERDALKADAYALWMLLDDIDTADDMAKNSDAIYRSLCQQYQKKRWAIMSGETIDAIAAIQGEKK